MYEVLSGQYPDLEIINATVAGGAGSNAKAVLATRMQSGDPPDSFQVHAGHELIDTWVVADAMEPVTFIFEENGWMDAYPQGVIDIIASFMQNYQFNAAPDEFLDRWVSRFREDKASAARAYWSEINAGMEEIFGS